MILMWHLDWDYCNDPNISCCFQEPLEFYYCTSGTKVTILVWPKSSIVKEHYESKFEICFLNDIHCILQSKNKSDHLTNGSLLQKPASLTIWGLISDTGHLAHQGIYNNICAHPDNALCELHFKNAELLTVDTFKNQGFIV